MTLTVDVHDVAAGGDGIARAGDGRIVFVRGGVPGDRVEVDIVRERRTSLHAVVRTVLAPAADRVSPPCPHAGAGCGGCGWQHVSTEGQRSAKVRIVEESLRRLSGLDVGVRHGPVLPTTGFRTSIRLVLGPEGPAFRVARSHDRVPVDTCLIAYPALGELLDPASAVLGSQGEVTLRVGSATGERMAVYSPAVPEDAALPADVAVVGRDELRGGTGPSITEIVADRRFRVSARSFFQTRTDGAEALVDAVRTAAADVLGGGRLADLYGGVGLFSATLGEAMDVTLVESSRSSVADARHNLCDRAAHVVRRPVEQWRPTPHDVVVADPPRAGLGASAVDVLAGTGASRVVLVSCDPASLGRDAGLLVDAGYDLVSSVLVDLFPHTPHVEVVSRFDRRGGTRA